MSGAPKGNQNARNARECKDALKYVLENSTYTGIKKGMALREICKRLAEKAMDGDLPAIKEVMDRLDGRPSQTTILQDDNRTVEEYNIDELQQMLSDYRREDAAIEAKKKEQANGINAH